MSINTNNIVFESDYHSICHKCIYDTLGSRVHNHCAYIEVIESKLVESFEEIFGDSSVGMEKSDHIFDKDSKEYDVYSYRVRFSNKVALMYSVSDRRIEDGETVPVASGIQVYFHRELRKGVVEFLDGLRADAFEEVVEDRFFIIGVDQGGYMLTPETITIKDVDLGLNYGKKFLDFHERTIEKLTDETSGLLLLYGEPGSGKTTYIRHLIGKLCGKKSIIYVPSFLVEQIANPEFITFIERQRNSILILEDAEYVLQSREDGYNVQAVSNLLNITSGLLNDATGLQVIATFNMDKKNIDKALLRPGRLIDEYKFDRLSPQDATALSVNIGMNIEYSTPATLAEIYAGRSVTKKNKKKVGFRNEDV